MESLNKSLMMFESLGHSAGMAIVNNNLGFIYDSQGNIQKALECYHKSLRILEKTNDDNGIAELMNKDVVFELDPLRLRPEKSEVERLFCSYKKAEQIMNFYTNFQMCSLVRPYLLLKKVFKRSGNY